MKQTDYHFFTDIEKILNITISNKPSSVCMDQNVLIVFTLQNRHILKSFLSDEYGIDISDSFISSTSSDEVWCFYGKQDKKIILLLHPTENLDFWSLSSIYNKVFTYLVGNKMDARSFLCVPLISPNMLDSMILGLYLAAYPVNNVRPLARLHKQAFMSYKCTCIIPTINNDILFKATDLQNKITNMSHMVQGIYLYRFLADGNADDITAKFLSDISCDLSEDHCCISKSIYDKNDILMKLHMGLLYAVSRGGASEQKLIHLTYNPDKKLSPEYTNPAINNHVVLIGKGITYDTGGLDIKPSSGMYSMRFDMSGAALVLGAFHALTKQQVPIKLSLIIPTCDNAIGPDSYKQGDVYLGYDGTSVEISHTDAEGRLILADAISFACDKVIEKDENVILLDFATLTGAMLVALGSSVCGFFANDDGLADNIKKAASIVFEPVWRLPLIKSESKALQSKVADIANCSEDREAGAVKGAMFLEHFVKKHPNVKWAHFDIAGVSSTTSQAGISTGFGVRLLCEIVTQFLNKK